MEIEEVGKDTADSCDILKSNCDGEGVAEGGDKDEVSCSIQAIPTSSVLCSGSADDEKVTIWTGYLEWYDHEGMIQNVEFLGDSSQNESSKIMSCTFVSKVIEGCSEIPLSLMEGTAGYKLGLHLIPKSQLKKLDWTCLQDTKNIKLVMEGCPARGALTKLLRTGRYAGCIHLNQDTITSKLGVKELNSEMGVIILLYSRRKQAIMGFVPNDMTRFVDKLLQVYPDHSSSTNHNHKQQKEIEKSEVSSGTILIENDTPPESEIENGTPTPTSPMQDQQMDVEYPVQSYWSYDITQNFRPSNHLAITSTEAKPIGRNKRLNFFKGCKWAPDGSCLLSNADDDILRLYNVPESLYAVSDWNSCHESDNMASIESVLKIREGGQVYDYCWYPLMSSYDPVSCCFLTTTSDAPVHLWDAFTGKLRASYLPYDHLDQVVSAHSVAFDSTGESIICGFDTMIRTFDITRPGRQCVERKLKHSQITELSQPGIISCIAVNPSLKSVMAVGSYLKTVGLYHDDGSVLCILQGHLGGVTQLKFSSDGSKLFSGGRKDSRLICWDMRYMGENYSIFDRIVTTNQRIYYDITPNGKYLVTGGTDGIVKIWDLSSSDNTEPFSTFQANTDCVNGVSTNPFLPLLATSSGQRHINKIEDYSDDEDEDATKVLKNEADIKLWKLC